MTTVFRHVIVGYDGSLPAAAAVQWAAAEAALRRSRLTIVGCYTLPIIADYALYESFLVDADASQLRAATIDALQVVAGRAIERHPGLEVNVLALHGGARESLVEQAERADLLAVGATGAGRAASWLLGSVAHGVIRTSPCPVAVVRPASDGGEVAVSRGRIVVGFDPAGHSRAAVDWAIEEAELHGLELDVVHAWSPAGSLRDVHDVAEVGAARELDAAVEHACETGGAVAHRRLVTGDPTDALVEASRAATMVVVGSRRRGALRSLLLGSVAHGVIADATCPVIVVGAPTASGDAAQPEDAAGAGAGAL